MSAHDSVVDQGCTHRSVSRTAARPVRTQEPRAQYTLPLTLGRRPPLRSRPQRAPHDSSLMPTHPPLILTGTSERDRGTHAVPPRPSFYQVQHRSSPSSPPPEASTSKLSPVKRTLNAGRLGRAQGRTREGCWCAGNKTVGVVGLLFGLPSVLAGPVGMSPRATGKMREVREDTRGASDAREEQGAAMTEGPTPTVAAYAGIPTPDRVRMGKRDGTDLDEIDGRYLATEPWTLFGRTGPSTSSSSSSSTVAPTPSGTGTKVVGGEHIQLQAAAVDTPTAAPPDPSNDPSLNDPPDPSSSSLSVPTGWTPRTRATNFYAVPVIIAMSIIVSIMCVVIMLVTFRWRRRRRAAEKRRRKGDPEKVVVGKKGNGRVGEMVRKTMGKLGRKKGADGAASPRTGGSVAGTGRVRQRRGNRVRQIVARSRNGEDSGDEDEGSALTHTASSSSGPPPATLSSRLHQMVSSSAARSSLTVEAPSTHHSSTSSLPLSRTPSHTSTLSHHTVDSTLGQPTDTVSPLPTAPLSEFGILFPSDTVLPVLGPPAYRPNSMTVGSTSRLTESIIPVQTPVQSSSTLPQASLPEEEEEEEVEEEDDPNATHWPNEKVPRQRRSRPVTRPTVALPSIEIQPPSHSEPDPTEFAAHLATDDKAVLRRIREAASEYPQSSRMGGEASAPMMDVDEDGFEAYDSSLDTVMTEVQVERRPSVGSLPEPPRKVDNAFVVEEGTSSLPTYGRRVQVNLEPSAPPAEDWEEEDLGQEDGEVLERRRGEGII